MSDTKTWPVQSSWGVLTIDSSGIVVSVEEHDSEGDFDRSDYLTGITKVNLDEYFRFYKSESLSMIEGFDILDLGIWYANGDYSPPASDWRKLPEVESMWHSE